jgi:hypothetical protein
MPHLYRGILPRRGIMPQCFLLIFLFWPDFRFFGTIFGQNFIFGTL